MKKTIWAALAFSVLALSISCASDIPRIQDHGLHFYGGNSSSESAGSFQALMLSENSPLLNPEPRRYTLAEARSLLIYHSPALAAESKKWREALARIIGAGLSPNPELNIMKEMIDPNHAFGSGTWKLNVSQRFETAGKLEARMASAEAEAEIERMRFLASVSSALLEVERKYAEVLRIQSEIELLKEQEQVLSRQVDSAAALFTGGKITEFALLNRKAEQKNLAIMRANSERALVAACAEMNGMLGLEPGVFTGAADGWDAVSKFPSEEKAKDGIQKHPLVLAAKKSIIAAEKAVEKAEAYASPDFSFSLGWAHAQDDPMNQYDYFGLGFMIPLPLFDRNEGMRTETRIAVLRAKDEIRAVEKELNAGLIAAFANVKRSVAALAEYDGELIPTLRRASELAEATFEGGKTSSIEALEPRLALIEAEKAALMERENAAREAARIRYISSEPGE